MEEPLIHGYNQTGMKKAGYTAWKILAFIGFSYGLIAMLWSKLIGLGIMTFAVVVWITMCIQQKSYNKQH